MKRKVQETFDVVENGSAYKKQRTSSSYGTEDLHCYSLLDPMPVTSSVPLYFAESRYSPAFRTFQAFYNNSEFHYDYETEFYFVQQQNYNDDCCTYESPRYEPEQYSSYNSIEYYTSIPDYSTRSGRMQSLQSQNQIAAPNGLAGKRAEEKDNYKQVIVTPLHELDSPLASPTHNNTSDVSLPTQKKPLSKVPDPSIIKQLRELIDSQKIFQKDISAKLGVSPSTLSLYMNSKARTNGWSALERKICDIIQEIMNEETAQSPKSDRSPMSTVMTSHGSRGSSHEQYEDSP
jgi:predicted transcriptional regulator